MLKDRHHYLTVAIQTIKEEWLSNIYDVERKKAEPNIWRECMVSRIHAQTAQTHRTDVGPMSGDVGNDVGLMSEPTSARYRQKGGRCSPDIADIGPTACLYRSRLDVGRCRQCRLNVGLISEADIGNRAAGVYPILPISARPRACTEARCRPDVGSVGSMSEADIGPTCIPDIAFVLNY